MGVRHAPYAVSNGLVFSVDAGNLNSYPGTGTTWKNAVRDNPTNATLVGSPSFTNNGARSYLFMNGSGQRASLTASITDSASGDKCSIEMIVANGNSSPGMMMSFGSQQGVMYSSNNLGFFSFNSDLYGFDITSVAATWQTNSLWSHFVFNFNRGDYTQNSIFYNGVSRSLSQKAGSQNTSRTFNGGGVTINGPSGNENIWKVNLFRVYNRNLSALECLQNFYAFRGRFGL